MYLNSLNMQCFHLIVYKEMNRTNSVIILASLGFAAFLVLNTAPMIDVSASEDRSDYYYPPPQDYPPAQDYPPSNGYDSDRQYNQDRHVGYSDQYESGYYEDHYGKPYKIE